MGVTFTATTSTAVGAQAGADAERDWALDPIDHDLDVDDTGDALFDRSAEAVASDMNAEFNMWLGEWYLDLGEGFPWIDVLGSPLDPDRFRRSVEEHALLVPGVVKVQSYALTRDDANRSFSVDFEALCDTGQIIAAVIAASQGG